mmetsp:Transcript_30899/g.58678  ORF Transcript_30899/g.58678 Transcript_30899/m.58678 type:complete len:83 (-) Transcript_30899:65-313(-)
MQQQQRIISTIIRKLVMGKVVMTPATAGFLRLTRNESSCINHRTSQGSCLDGVRNLVLLEVSVGQNSYCLLLSAVNSMFWGE